MSRKTSLFFELSKLNNQISDFIRTTAGSEYNDDRMLQDSINYFYNSWISLNDDQRQNAEKLSNRSGITLENCLLILFVNIAVSCAPKEFDRMFLRLQKMPWQFYGGVSPIQENLTNLLEDSHETLSSITFSNRV